MQVRVFIDKNLLLFMSIMYRNLPKEDQNTFGIVRFLWTIQRILGLT